MNMTQNTKLVAVSRPSNYNGATATTEYICLKNADKVRFIIYTGAWAAGTAAVTLKQATADGGPLANLALTKYYYGTGDTLTEATATSNTFNLSSANTKYVIEVKASDLNVNDGYSWVVLSIASPGSNDDYYAVLAEVYGLRYARGASSPTTLV